VENGVLSGWRSWDRTGVLTREWLLINWETPNIANNSELVLRRLLALKDGARDKYSYIARDLEKRIRYANPGRFRPIPATKMKASSAHG
jgi:hypothetical protein